MSEAPTVGEPHATQDEVLGILCRWTKDDDYDLLTCIRDLRRALATLPVVPPQLSELEVDEIACRYATMGSEGSWIFREGALHDFVGEVRITLPVGDVEPRSSFETAARLMNETGQGEHLTESYSPAVRRPGDE